MNGWNSLANKSFKMKLLPAIKLLTAKTVSNHRTLAFLNVAWFFLFVTLSSEKKKKEKKPDDSKNGTRVRLQRKIHSPVKKVNNFVQEWTNRNKAKQVDTTELILNVSTRSGKHWWCVILCFVLFQILLMTCFWTSVNAAPTCKDPSNLDLQQQLDEYSKIIDSSDVRFAVIPTLTSKDDSNRRKRSADEDESECPKSISDLPSDPSAELRDRSVCPWTLVRNQNNTR